MAERVLPRRELNRATLARQLLLAREEVGAEETIERLAGLQAQDVPPPYIALWSRLAGFDRPDLTEPCRDGRVVRASLMRHTVHLFTARDYQRFHTAILPGLVRGWRGGYGKRLDGLEVDAVVDVAREYIREQPRRYNEIREHLARTFPRHDRDALAFTVRTHLPMLRVPDGDGLAYGGNSPFALAEPRPDPHDNVHDLVRRYLAALGPASPADMTVWSNRTGLKPVFEELRDELVAFRDENGRELFDLPDAPRPPADTPAPPRLLPVYDNLLLSHQDRSRVIAEGYRERIQIRVGQLLSAFLVDGEVAGTWTRDKRTGAIEIKPFREIATKDRRALDREARALERFLA